MSQGVILTKLPTGVPGLDAVLGGGLPELSFNLIAGGPGNGKTTLAHQIMFANASPECPALYITIVGEPPLKMLRYQQQFTFFDTSKLPGSIRYLHLASEIHKGLDHVLARIIKEVEDTSPRLVFVDSFRAIVRKSQEPHEPTVQDLVQRLAVHLTSCEATTFLIGEYSEQEVESDPVFTIADGMIWLSQVASRNSVVRQMQVIKMRGQGQVPGVHTMKMTEAGLRIYPRIPTPEPIPPIVGVRERRCTGVAGIDEMLGGGIPTGFSVMIIGPTGSGKTILATQFILEGVARGEPGVIALFEKRPAEFLSSSTRSDELTKHVEAGAVKLLYIRPLDLSVDETLEVIVDAVHASGAKRIVIDSLSGFELALAPPFREDFRESMYRMVGSLVDLGVTVVMTAEVPDSYTDLRFSPHGVSFLTDGIILQRYTEIGGELKKVLAVAKMRGHDHAKELRLYEITDRGLVMGDALTEYDGILVGKPRLSTPPRS